VHIGWSAELLPLVRAEGGQVQVGGGACRLKAGQLSSHFLSELMADMFRWRVVHKGRLAKLHQFESERRADWSRWRVVHIDIGWSAKLPFFVEVESGQVQVEDGA